MNKDPIPFILRPDDAIVRITKKQFVFNRAPLFLSSGEGYISPVVQEITRAGL